MPQTSELKLSSSLPPAIIAKAQNDVNLCNSPGCIHTGK